MGSYWSNDEGGGVKEPTPEEIQAAQDEIDRVDAANAADNASLDQGGPLIDRD